MDVYVIWVRKKKELIKARQLMYITVKKIGIKRQNYKIFKRHNIIFLVTIFVKGKYQEVCEYHCGLAVKLSMKQILNINSIGRSKLRECITKRINGNKRRTSS